MVKWIKTLKKNLLSLQSYVVYFQIPSGINLIVGICWILWKVPVTGFTDTKILICSELLNSNQKLKTELKERNYFSSWLHIASVLPAYFKQRRSNLSEEQCLLNMISKLFLFPPILNPICFLGFGFSSFGSGLLIKYSIISLMLSNLRLNRDSISCICFATT